MVRVGNVKPLVTRLAFKCIACQGIQVLFVCLFFVVSRTENGQYLMGCMCTCMCAHGWQPHVGVCQLNSQVLALQDGKYAIPNKVPVMHVSYVRL